MSLQAYPLHGVRGVRIVPIGLLFERKEAPRSRVLMQVGELIQVDPAVDAGVSVDTLTQLVAARLATVTLNFDSSDDAERLQRVGSTLSALLEPKPTPFTRTPWRWSEWRLKAIPNGEAPGAKSERQRLEHGNGG